MVLLWKNLTGMHWPMTSTPPSFGIYWNARSKPGVTSVPTSLMLFVVFPGPFYSSTGNVSSRYETDITPAGWTFSIWGVIYTWLTLMVLYITSYVFRGWVVMLSIYWFTADSAHLDSEPQADETDICLSVNRSWAQSLLPYTFYFCWLANMVLNIAWLLLWDREYVFCLLVCLICTEKRDKQEPCIQRAIEISVTDVTKSVGTLYTSLKYWSFFPEV